MKKVAVGILYLTLVSSSLSFAAKEDAKLLDLMHSFYGTLVELKPYVNSEEAFKDPQNNEKIKALLKSLEKKVDENQLKLLSKKSGFGVTYGLLGRHLKETNYLFEKEIYAAAQNNLKATTGLCIACHDRLPKPTAVSVGSVVGKNQETFSLNDAEFFYLAHDFDRAILTYDTLIQKYDGSQKQFDFGLLYRRKIAYFARIQRKPKEAIASLKIDLTNPRLPLDVQQNLKDWIYFFEAWSKEGKKDPSRYSNQRLLDYARVETEKNTGGRKIAVSDPYVVNLLRVSGLLYERVFKQPHAPQTAEMLYLLAKCERDLGSIQNYSLADVYLKECVVQFPQNPIAKKCFADYEVAMKQKLPSGMSEYINSSIEVLRGLIQKTPAH